MSPRSRAERLAVGGERLVDAAGLFVERGQQPELVGVERVLLLEAGHELGQAIVGAIDLGDRLVHLAAHAGGLPREAQRLFELRQGLLLAIRSRVVEEARQQKKTKKRENELLRGWRRCLFDISAGRAGKADC